MYATIKRDNGLLIQMLKDNFDIVGVDYTKIKYYADCNIKDTLSKVIAHPKPSFSLDKSIVLEGEVDKEELEQLRTLEKQNTLNIATQKHMFEYVAEGGYGHNQDPYEYLHADDDYFVKIYLHVDETESFMQENIYQFINQRA